MNVDFFSRQSFLDSFFRFRAHVIVTTVCTTGVYIHSPVARTFFCAQLCRCNRTRFLAATQVPEKVMNACALAFFAGWLRSLRWKRLLLRSDNERALLAFLRAAAASLEGVEVVEQACEP